MVLKNYVLLGFRLIVVEKTCVADLILMDGLNVPSVTEESGKYGRNAAV